MTRYPAFPSRRTSAEHRVAMTGVRLGDRLLQIGCADPTLVGALGSKVGLSGRACVVVTGSEMATRARRGADRAGVLIEVEQTDLSRLPFADSSFDLATVDSTDGMFESMSPTDRHASLLEALRILVPRGRVVLIESGPRRGLAGLLRRQPARLEAREVEQGVHELQHAQHVSMRGLERLAVQAALLG